MEKKKILIVSQVVPFPLHDGGCVDIYYRLQALKEIGYSITLVAYFPSTHSPDTHALEEICEAVYLIPYEGRKIGRIFSFTPYFVSCRSDRKELDRVIAHLKKQNASFSSILCESHHVYSACCYLKEQLHLSKIYLRSHNNEPKFFWSLGKTSPFFSLRRYFFFAEACKYLFYEKKLLRTFPKEDEILHISFDEYIAYKRRYPFLKQSFLPAAIDQKQMSCFRRTKEKNVLFVGALFSPNNLHGLKWYLQKVHLSLCRKYPDYTFVIAGNTKGIRVKKIEKWFQKYPQIKFYDTPSDLEEIYASSQVFVNPMRFGAGVKLKTVQAVLNGMPVVTTAIGNEGTGLLPDHHLYVCNTPSVFRQKVEQLLTCNTTRKAMVEKAQTFMKQAYDQKLLLMKLIGQ